MNGPCLLGGYPAVASIRPPLIQRLLAVANIKPALVQHPLLSGSVQVSKQTSKDHTMMAQCWRLWDNVEPPLVQRLFWSVAEAEVTIHSK